MKNENHESVTDVLAEMHAFKNHPNARKTVKGTFVAGILDGLARRIEAALKREHVGNGETESEIPCSPSQGNGHVL